MRITDGAVSEVVGEMMLIAIVLILVAIFATSISALIPDERAPVVNIKMNWSYNDELNQTTIDLWHKGGDWVEVSDLSVMVIENETMAVTRYRYNDADYPFTLYNATGYEVSIKQSFDLGDRLRISFDGIGYEIRLVTPRAVLFDGVIE